MKTKMEEKICKYCGKAFMPKTKTQVCCSAECNRRSVGQRRHEEAVARRAQESEEVTTVTPTPDKTAYELVKANMTKLPTFGAFAEMRYAMIPVTLCDTTSRFRETRTVRREIASKFNPLYCDPIKVVDRPDTYVFEVADGGKRVVAAIENGVPVIPAFIFENKDEAFPVQKFLEQDMGKDVLTKHDKHAALVDLGDPIALKLEEIAKKYGLVFSSGQGRKKNTENAEIPMISYNIALGRVKEDVDTFVEVLEVIKESGWTKHSKCYNEVFLFAFMKALRNCEAGTKEVVHGLLVDYCMTNSPEDIVSHAAFQDAQDRRSRIIYTVRDEVVLANGIGWKVNTSASSGRRMGLGNGLKAKIEAYIAENPSADPVDIAEATGCCLTTLRKYCPDILITLEAIERYNERAKIRREQYVAKVTKEATAKRAQVRHTKGDCEIAVERGEKFIAESGNGVVNIDALTACMGMDDVQDARSAMYRAGWSSYLVDKANALYVFSRTNDSPRVEANYLNGLDRDTYAEIRSRYQAMEVGTEVDAAKVAEEMQTTLHTAKTRLYSWGFSRKTRSIWVKTK